MFLRAFLLAFFLIFTLPAACLAEGDAQAGEAKIQTCATCHGAQGNSENPAWPKLAGQGAKYIVQQLRLFKNNVRHNVLMNAQVATLSDQDMQDIASYYAAQSRKPGATDPKLFSLGESIYRGGNAENEVPACLSCHGPDGAGNPAAAFPRLSYQHALYTQERLKVFRLGVSHSEIMNGVSANLSDDEIKAVASYIQGLH